MDEDDIPEDVGNAQQVRAAQASLRQLNKSAVDVISDYLRELWKHSIINIRRAIGGQLVDISRFRIVATIPAIWPAYAQLRMFEAINKADILKARTAGETILEFLSEPEAAALATIKNLSAYNKANIEVRAYDSGMFSFHELTTIPKAGDHFVVCDAGGGTVVSLQRRILRSWHSSHQL